MRHRKFDCECGIGTGVTITAIGRDDDRCVTLFSEFSPPQHPIAFAVTGENHDCISLGGRAIGFEHGTNASQDGCRKNPDRRKNGENDQQQPQRSSPELRGSMWPTVFNRK